MKKIYNVVNEAGMVRKSFSQEFRAKKYCHDLNQWLAPQTGGKLIWFVVSIEVSELLAAVVRF